MVYHQLASLADSITSELPFASGACIAARTSMILGNEQKWTRIQHLVNRAELSEGPESATVAGLLKNNPSLQRRFFAQTLFASLEPWDRSFALGVIAKSHRLNRYMVKLCLEVIRNSERFAGLGDLAIRGIVLHSQQFSQRWLDRFAMCNLGSMLKASYVDTVATNLKVFAKHRRLAACASMIRIALSCQAEDRWLAVSSIISTGKYHIKEYRLLAKKPLTQPERGVVLMVLLEYCRDTCPTFAAELDQNYRASSAISELLARRYRTLIMYHGIKGGVLCQSQLDVFLVDRFGKEAFPRPVPK